MTKLDDLVDRHIKEYNSRLKHIDELAKQAAALEEESHLAELAELKSERNKLADYLKELEQNRSEKTLEMTGPMYIWDVIAQRLEKLVEKIIK
ncbi:hypothetical protein [Amphritea balenae]|uniref:Uncharacterized protein n=1 Tax=Amphritea balenae TaxID=452629 RepID=A0A3P1SWB2_9GAMM|nr:hypothetical protein [Amphritea balenae]RRD01502.1 hypothetical protein EHS89_02785 [Amphritea balenae]GGK56526.1 hypothetical protein GCM10007941_03370 [Amphritea balenae]